MNFLMKNSSKMRMTNQRKTSDLMRLMTRLIIGLLVIFACLTPIGSVSGDNSLEISNVTHAYEFGSELTITANLPQPELIRNMTLIIQPDSQQTRQVEVFVSAGGGILTQYDLTTNGFDPFTRIYFWFEAEMSDGSISSSSSYWFDYIDNRFAWKSNSTNLFTIFWTEGDTSYGQKLQSIARSGLEKSTQLLPVVPILPVEIYIYPNSSSMQSVLSLDSQSWVNGHTFINSNKILVADSPPLADTTDLERTIPHETMHLLQYQIMSTSYSNAPAWLLEGLATQSELYANPDLEREFSSAQKADTLLSFGDLCHGFPNDANLATLAYAQSSSFVAYIQRTYGNQVFPVFLQNAANGLDCEQNVKSSLGITLSQVELDWKTSIISSSNPSASPPYQLMMWIGIPLLLIITGFLIFNYRKRQVNISQEE